MDEERVTRTQGRVRLDPKIRGEGKGNPVEQGKDRTDDDIKTIDVEKIIKKNALRLAITIIIFAIVFAVKSLPFSLAQRVSQGIKWAVTYQMDWKDDVMDRRNIVPAISNQISRFIGSKEIAGVSEGDHTYVTPVSGGITSSFEESIHPVFNTKIQPRGIEISGSSAREIQSIAKGKVLQVQESLYGGEKIVVGHDDSMKSVYEGCFEGTHKIHDEIEQGEILGKTKSVEEGEESVFYFELWKGDQAVDPSDYISFEGVPAS